MIIFCSIDLSYATPIQIHAVNIVFDCRFPLPENFQHEEDLLDDLSVKQVIRNVWKRVSSFFLVMKDQK